MAHLSRFRIRLNSSIVRGIVCERHQEFLISRTLRRFLSEDKGKQKWHLAGAACVERLPIVSKPLKSIEIEYKNLLLQLEIEKSWKSDHEKKHNEDIKRMQRLKSNEKPTEADLEAAARLSALDLEDKYAKELSQFQAADMDSKINDVKSLRRLLDKRLLLLVKQKLGKDSKWILPQAVIQSGETLRQTAERALQLTCGTTLKTMFIGNAPCGFYSYKYPEDVVKECGHIGIKVFFFSAQYQSGNVALEVKNASDFQWASRSELTNLLKPRYIKSLDGFLIKEEFDIQEYTIKMNKKNLRPETLEKKAASAS